MQRKTLTKIELDGRSDVVCALEGGPNGAAIGPGGDVYLANNGGSFSFHDAEGMNIPGPTPPDHRGGSIQRVSLQSGRLETLYEACDGDRFEGPNDLVFDQTGGFWFTDHGSTTTKGRNFGGLYYARADGSEVVRQRTGLFSPNGVGLSPDERTVYVADTYLGRLWAFDVLEPGRLGPATLLQPGRVVCNLQGYQLLDSLAVEAGGKVCVGTLVNGGITVFDPDGSTEHFGFPDLLCTNICFGGADMQDAWITASGTGKLFKCRWPRPGLKLAFNA
jgi:gluconolactonase